MVGETLAEPLVVEIQDLLGMPLAGIDVVFSVIMGDASIVEDQPIVTGANGRASATVQLGDTPGEIDVAVTASDVNSPLATFMAEGDGPALFAITSTVPPGWICPGDCDGQGNVSIDEVLSGINIALGTAPIEQCEAADRGADGQVTVDDLVEVVGMAISGCPVP